MFTLMVENESPALSFHLEVDMASREGLSASNSRKMFASGQEGTDSHALSLVVYCVKIAY